MTTLRHVYYLRNDELRNGRLLVPVLLDDLLKSPQLVIDDRNNPMLHLRYVDPLEIAEGMAEHACRERNKCAEACIGAAIGWADWQAEMIGWDEEAERLRNE